MLSDSAGPLRKRQTTDDKTKPITSHWMINVVMKTEFFIPNPEARAGKRCSPLQKFRRIESWSKYGDSGDVFNSN